MKPRRRIRVGTLLAAFGVGLVIIALLGAQYRIEPLTAVGMAVIGGLLVLVGLAIATSRPPGL